MPFPDIDPIIFQIGPLAIRWYGVAYIVGLLLAWWLAKRIAVKSSLWNKDQSPITTQQLDDFLLWAMVGIILGGRLGFVIFYDLPNYLQNPIAIIRIWDGGMSFHGGMLGVLMAMIFFTRKHGIPVFALIDLVSSVAPIGLFFGRIANFINTELWGRTTNVSWGVVFPGAGPVPRHPSQLYEAAIEGILLLAILQVLIWNKGALRRPALIGGLFFAGYGSARFFVEFFREPDQHIGFLFGNWLTMGMLLSLPMIFIGIITPFLWSKISAKN